MMGIFYGTALRSRLAEEKNFWKHILILSSHLRSCLPRVLFPLGFPMEMLYAPFHSLTSTTYATHPTLDFITPLIFQYDCRS